MKIFGDELTEGEFLRISNLVRQRSGIKLPVAKKTMMESRLRKRIRSLGMDSFKEYCAYLFSGKSHSMEVGELINALTTNKTDFFREKDHFTYLTHSFLPDWVRAKERGRVFRIWSAGCSTGEEPYTMAIVLEEFRRNNPEAFFKYEIIASDIDTVVLKKAQLGIFHRDKVEVMDKYLWRRYFMRSRDKESPLRKVIPELRETITFRQLNFRDHTYNVADQFDAIFCRNVIIYFERQEQERIINRLTDHLSELGNLFLGHSENITGMHVPLVSVIPTVFKKKRP